MHRLRKSRGWIQADLANSSGLRRSYISNIEKGVRNPSVKALGKLASALKVNTSELIPSEIGSGKIEIVPLPKVNMVPVLGRMSGGPSKLNWDKLTSPAPFGCKTVPFYKQHRRTRTFGLRMNGDSMAPRVKNGEVGIFSLGAKPRSGDEALILTRKGKTYFRIVYWKQGRVLLKTYNDHDADVILDKSDIVRAVRLVGAYYEAARK